MGEKILEKVDVKIVTLANISKHFTKTGLVAGEIILSTHITIQL